MTFTYPLVAPVSFCQVDPDTADELLVRWGHYLGEQGRPFGREDWALLLDGEPLAVACSASTVSDTLAGYQRGEVVELARLVRRPDAAWVTRVALRLWREVAAPRWHYWPVKAACAYSKNDRHEGRIYRFDGWEKVSGDCGGSKGGGTWTEMREEGHPALGKKTLWLFRYEEPVLGPDVASLPQRNGGAT